MPRYTKRRFTEQLPPVFCTPEMKEKIVSHAERENISISQIMRDALSLFLSQNYSDAIVHNSEANLEPVKEN